MEFCHKYTETVIGYKGAFFLASKGFVVVSSGEKVNIHFEELKSQFDGVYYLTRTFFQENLYLVLLVDIFIFFVEKTFSGTRHVFCYFGVYIYFGLHSK